MSIDIGRELAVRSIAHNISYRFGSAVGPSPTDGEIAAHALRLAKLFDPTLTGREELAVAAIAMWRAAGQRDTSRVALAGLQPEEAPAHDY